MKILVWSLNHMLLPFAWLLMKESHEVQVVVGKQRFDTCWDGKIDKVFKGSKSVKEKRKYKVAEAASESGSVVLTDAGYFVGAMGGHGPLYGVVAEQPTEQLPPLTVGYWFDGEAFHHRHFLYTDWGAQTNGMGVMVPGALTLIRPDGQPLAPELEALAGLADELKSRSFKGLVQASMAEGRVSTWRAGWNFLQTHAFFGDLGGGLGQLFGMGGSGELEHRFTVVVPVSVPPWPMGGLQAEISMNRSSKPHSIPNEGVVDTGQVFFHDMRVRDHEAQIAGTDGLVGVVQGSANTLSLARKRALQVAANFRLPEMQFRVDAGSQVEGVLVRLEEAGLVV